MQRYELVEGTSSKFWEVAVTGSDLTVNFGRIGTAGQSKTKSFGDEAAALKERDKLIKEKAAKGYTLSGSAAQGAAGMSVVRKAQSKTAHVPQGATSPVATRAPAAIASAAAMAPAPAPAVIAAASTGIEWPSGGFEWKPEFRKLIPVVRGINVPPVADPQLFACLLVLPDEVYGTWKKDLLASVGTSLGKTWTYWGSEGSRLRITRDAVSNAEPDFWLELVAQTIFGDKADEAWVASHVIGLHGLAFALELAVMLHGGMFASGKMSSRIGAGLYPALREAIAAAGDAAYEDVLSVATRLREQDLPAMFLCSYLFPHIEVWAVECLDAGWVDPEHRLMECVMPAASFLQYLKLKGSNWYLEYIKPALFLQIHLHGEAVAGTLAYVLSRDIAGLGLMLRMRTPRLVTLLMARMDRRETRDALDELATRYPAAVIKSAIDYAQATRDRGIEGWVIRLALREQAALPAALAALDEPSRLRFEATLAALQREDAPVEALPPVLREPPWLGKARQAELSVVAATPIEVPAVVQWDDQEKARAAFHELPRYLRNMPQGSKFPQNLAIKSAGAERLLAGKPLEPADLGEVSYSSATVDMVLASPSQAQLLLWNCYPADRWSHYSDNTAAIQVLLATHGVTALPGLVKFTEAWPDKGLPLALKIDSVAFARIAMHALRNLKKSRGLAVDWLRVHQRTAMVYALPVAFQVAPGPAREDARYGIRWFGAQGWGDVAKAAAQEYGADMPAALEALLGADPLLVLPARMPKLPAFFVPASFRRPELASGPASGLALPVASVEYIGMMLAISRLDAQYPGLDIVKQACTPASLAEFAWDLFEAWMAAGAPNNEGWAFTALGLLGNDETARRLSPRIREWPGESAHARAVAGLDLLAAIGTDTALMHLNGIAGKVKFKALQERAREKIAVVAETRGFTTDELADRLVPDMGLDEQSALVLDFGTRQFHVSFDEALKPFVRGAQGIRLKDLPKPIKSDDAALAETAAERYKQMKKDAKAIASLQVMRLEMGMVARRRWPAVDFRMFFLEHPLMRHLAARLVWGVYAGEQLVCNFRVAEDWSFADADDTLYALPEQTEGCSIGISHVLEMPPQSLDAWGQLFADYEILQPFKQLGRETYSLTPEEQGLRVLTRFKDKQVATGSVMGLVNRGWERGQAQDGGWVGEFSKRVDADMEVIVQLDPGTIVGDMSYEPKQRLPAVTLRQRGTYDQTGLLPFARLDPIVVSEVLRDLELLAVVKD